MAKSGGALIYRQSIWTRITHWIWAISLFFLMLTGLQIFNAHPALYIGQESGFEYDNAILRIGARQAGDQVQGFTQVFGTEFDTTGVLGVSGDQVQAFPPALTIPSNRSLAMGRVIRSDLDDLACGKRAQWPPAHPYSQHGGFAQPAARHRQSRPSALSPYRRL
jgi:thiosulfate reductase cytochrome b subunit